jgi:hypothetical protein
VYVPGAVYTIQDVVNTAALKKSLKEKEKQLQKATKAYERHLEKEFTGEGVKRVWGKVEKAVEAILNKYNIYFQVYFGGTLIGAHVHRLLENSTEIMKEIEAKINELTADEFKSQVEKECASVGGLFRVYYNIHVSIRSKITQTMAQRRDLERYCKRFGELWRIRFPNRKALPKLHVIESHVPAAMYRWGCLGVFSEEDIERQHHLDKILDRVFCGVKGYERSMMVKRRAQDLRTDQLVVDRMMEVEEGRKRKLVGGEQQGARKVAKEEKEVEKVAKEDVERDKYTK